MKHYLGACGRGEAGYGRELLALFARNPSQATEHLKIWRDSGGTHGCVPSMDKGLGANIDAHIAYIAEVKKLLDAG